MLLSGQGAQKRMRIGVISDTHNLLRQEVLDALEGCGAILHAGDICREEILDRIARTGPVWAVRGNNDFGWAERLKTTLTFEVGGLRFAMAHRRRDLPADLSGFDVAVFGHTHQYTEQWLEEGGRRTLLLNPGSCGPQRFMSPVTMVVLTAGPDGLTARRIELDAGGRRPRPVPEADFRRQIETVVRETKRGRTPAEIEKKTGMDPELAEQIARLYVTHPGVTVEGIMTTMELGRR